MDEGIPHIKLDKESLYHLLLGLDYDEVMNYCKADKTAFNICNSKQFWVQKALKDYKVDLSKSDNSRLDYLELFDRIPWIFDVSGKSESGENEEADSYTVVDAIFKRLTEISHQNDNEQSTEQSTEQRIYFNNDNLKEGIIATTPFLAKILIALYSIDNDDKFYEILSDVPNNGRSLSSREIIAYLEKWYDANYLGKMLSFKLDQTFKSRRKYKGNYITKKIWEVDVWTIPRIIDDLKNLF